MRKIVTAMVGIGAMLVSAMPAEAQHYQRRYEHRSAPRYYAPPRHVAPAPRYYARPRTNWVPYVVGGALLGVAGAYFYNQYGF